MSNEISVVFQNILQINDVTNDSDFFELGGQSLQATELVLALQQKYSVEIPLRSIFENPTPAKLAEYIKSHSSENKAAISTSKPISITPNVDKRFDEFPLNEVQHAYWIGRSAFLELGNVATHVYVEYESIGLDTARFIAAWNKLVIRHDMLRVVISQDGKQIVLPETASTNINVIDITHLPTDVCGTYLTSIRERMSHQVLTTEKPLYEIVLVKQANNKVRIHCSLDLLIADLWSTQIIFRELEQFYNDENLNLPPLKLTFRDYVLAEQSFEETTEFARAKDYWYKRLDDIYSYPDLPLAKSPSMISKPRFVRHHSKLGVQEWNTVKSIAKKYKLTPSALLLSAYAEVLTLYSKSPRFTLNLTLFNRQPVHPEIGNVIGDFTTLSLCAVNNEATESFLIRTRQLQQQLWSDLEYRQVSAIRLMREIARRKGRQGATFPVVFTSALIHGSTSSTSFLGEDIYGISQTPQIWLDHQVMERDGELVFNWDVVEELFPENMIQDMFSIYCNFLQKLIADESILNECSPCQIPDWQIMQRDQVNATSGLFAEDTKLHTKFLQFAESIPDKIAIVTSSKSLTYGELLQRATALAHEIRRLAPSDSQLIAVTMDKGWEQVVAVLAILIAGFAYVPISPELPRERRISLYATTKTPCVITQESLVEQLELPDNLLFLTIPKTIQKAMLPKLASGQQEQDLAYVIFTSGSTGEPKGVKISHRAAVNTILDINRKFGVTINDKVLAISSLSFDLSVYDIFGLLMVGGTIVIPDCDKPREPAHWLQLLCQHQISIWNSVPTLMAMLVEYANNLEKSLPESLRLVLMSGDWIPLPLISNLHSHLPQLEIISLGGATEAGIWSNFFPVYGVNKNWKSIPYGRPLQNQYFCILNNKLQPCPNFSIGQLYIGGESLASGYWEDEELTNKSFIIHPETGDLLYRTGDLGRYDNHGVIEFLGREDYQVKVQGYRIELGEIATHLMTFPGVQDAVVNVAEDETRGKSLVGYVVSNNESRESLFSTEIKASDSNLAQACSTALAEINEDIENIPEIENITEWKILQKRVDALIAKTLLDTFTKMGIFTKENSTLTLDQIITQGKIIPRYSKWLLRSLHILQEDQYIVIEDDVYKVKAKESKSETTDNWDDLLNYIAENRIKIDGLDFARRSAENLTEILTGKVEAVEILFAEGKSQTAIEMYKNEFADCNKIINKFFQRITASLSTEKSLQILEVGAGIGSTTGYVLSAVNPTNVRYVYTDISRYFLQVGKENFSLYPFIDYSLLDLEKNSAAQGFEQHSFDFVVAASVLHATADIEKTVANIKSLLAPGGVLVMIEETQFPRIFNLTMGLQQGFDRFDDAIRTDHPLLSSTHWQSVLFNNGFSNVYELTKQNSTADLLGLNVIIAQSSTLCQQFKENEIQQHLASILPKYMVPTKIIPIDEIPLSSNGKVDRKALPIPWKVTGKSYDKNALPKTMIEKTIALIWQEVLGVEQVGVEDDFFALGGDSLLATRVVTRIQEAFNLEVSVRNIFEAPKLSLLAKLVQNLGGVVAQQANEFSYQS